MKLHMFGMERYRSLTFPAMLFAAEASAHGLPVAKQMLEDSSFRDLCFVGDKAYCDSDWQKKLTGKNVCLLTPTKLKRG